MAATRLRKTFHYPSEDDGSDDELPKAIDEEEQEKLIATLKHGEEERNDKYKRIFLIIPPAAAAAFLPSLFTSPLLRIKLLGVLAITSLMCTAYILRSIPISRPPDAPISLFGRPIEADCGPIDRYVDYLDCGLSLLIFISGFPYRGRQGVHEYYWIVCVLPIVVFAMALSTRNIMLEVDVSELQRLKYNYKGA